MEKIEEREYTTYFKYCSDNKKVIKGIFENHKIRFSQPCVLNDPLEFNPAIIVNNNGNLYRWFRCKGIIYPSYERVLKHHLIDSQINSFGILSLTKKPSSYDMWSMYANGHKGFLIELKGDFNKHSCMKSKNGNMYLIRQVIYVEEYAINIDEFTNNEGVIQPESLKEQMFYRKLSRWIDEEEYRIVRPLIDCYDYQPDLNRTPRTPMDMKTYLFEFSLDCVESVTFGANMCYKNKKRIMKACENTKIKFLQAIIIRDEKEYAIGKTGKVIILDKNVFPKLDEMLPSNFVLDNAHVYDSNQIIEINSRSELPYYEDEKKVVDKYYMEQKARHNQNDS